MNLKNFTLKSQEVVQAAQQLTQEMGHQQIENEHLFKALLEVDDNVLPFIFKKLQVNFSIIKKLTDSAVDSLPKVTGGNMALSPNTSKTLIKAINISKASKDEFVATQHLLMALFDSRGNIIVFKITLDNKYIRGVHIKKFIYYLRIQKTVLRNSFSKL